MLDCVLVTEGSGGIECAVTAVDASELPKGKVTIQVEYSSLNYKDALACQGHPGVVQAIPHIPGIDAAGVVLKSESADFAVDDRVLVTGYELGQGWWGGWCQQVCVPAEWVVAIPPGLTARSAMILGTAGFTAAQSVLALQQTGLPNDAGPVVVTGASGGVGSVAVKLLAKLGYEVMAVSGKESARDALCSFGAAETLTRGEFTDTTKRPMLSARYAGGVDTVGGDMLSTLLRSTKYGGCVTACGLVAGADLAMTVYPFLLRGVALRGIASADCPYDRRAEIWERLAGPWSLANLEEMVDEILLAQAPEYATRILNGQISGRTLIRLPQ